MRGRSSLLPIPWMLALAGCGSVDPRPDYEAVARHIAEATGKDFVYRPGEEEAARARVESLLAGGITADEAVEICLLNNPILKASLARVGLAKSRLVQAGLLSNPSLVISLRFPSGGGLVALEAGLLQNLVELWRMPAKKRAARHELERTILEVSRHASLLALQAKTAYFEALAAGQAVEVARQNLRIAGELLRLVLERQEAGAASQIDVNLARSEALENEVALKDDELEARDALVQLGVLLGLPVPPESLVDALPDPMSPPIGVRELVELARASRLDVRAARAAATALLGRLDVEDQSLLGAVGLGAELERESDGESTVGPVLELELPIFDQNLARSASARFEYLEALELLKARRLLAAQDVHRAYERARAGAEAARFFRDRVLPQRNNGLEFAREAYRLGKVPLLTYLEAERIVIAARREYLERLENSAKVIVDLERATGLPFTKLGKREE